MMEEGIVCTICEENTTRYIKMLDGYICEKCENQIVSLDHEDIKYEYYHLLIKKMWQKFLISI